MCYSVFLHTGCAHGRQHISCECDVYGMCISHACNVYATYVTHMKYVCNTYVLYMYLSTLGVVCALAIIGTERPVEIM